MSVEIYLIRHGETEWSRVGKHTGSTDIPLTDHGVGQAAELAPWLGRVAFSHVFTSPRQRARQTCDHAGLGQMAEIEPDLAEWNYGEYEGVRSLEIHRDRPGWLVFRDGCPGGEMPDDVSRRADRLIARLRGLGGNIALFSHGHFSCALAARWIGSAIPEAAHLLLDTASLSILGERPKYAGLPVIALWNAVPAAFAAR